MTKPTALQEAAIEMINQATGFGGIAQTRDDLAKLMIAFHEQQLEEYKRSQSDLQKEVDRLREENERTRGMRPMI